VVRRFEERGVDVDDLLLSALSKEDRRERQAEAWAS